MQQSRQVLRKGDPSLDGPGMEEALLAHLAFSQANIGNAALRPSETAGD